ncbi:MAG: tetratricopeptide repeat protein [Casimicrobiaceae bacterium]
MPPGRNDPCPCGSGKKYKRCHGLVHGAIAPPTPSIHASTELRAGQSPAHALLDAAQTHVEAGDIARAESLYRKCVEQHPDDVEASTALGSLLVELGRVGEAEAIFRRQTAAAAPPASSVCNLGVAVLMQGRAAEAAEILQRAVSMRPGYAAALHNLGAALTELERFDEAERVTRESLALNDRDPAAHSNLGTLLMRRHDEAALACFDRALAIDPTFVDAHVHRATLFTSQGLRADAVMALRRAITLAPAMLPVWSNLLLTLLYSDHVSAEEILVWHRRFDTALGMTSTGSAPMVAPQRRALAPAARLRVGFLSPDLRQHPVGIFIEQLLEHHDRSQIEVVCYHDSVVDDEVSARLAAHAAKWVKTSRLNENELAERIAGDGLDVLIELAGHTGLRLRALARRLAPVQATWIGYPSTTGLSAIDVRLTDARADPPAHEALHSERLVRLPHSYYCYRPPDDAPLPAPLPALARAGEVTFGSFNIVAKITPTTLDLWAGVLRAAPRSRLLLKATAIAYRSVRERLLAELGARGVDAGRITFREWQTQGHLEAYGEVDIALDTWPFNGATTTCEALWMGVPVVTVAGDRPQARMGASILTAAGCADWIATEPAGLVAIAERLAGDLDALQAIRGSLRAKLSASPLLDGRGFARAFEQAMRAIVSHPVPAISAMP